MKKLFALLLAVSMVAGSLFVLTSCGEKKDETKENGAVTEEKQEEKAEEKAEENAGEIVGEWKLDSYVYTFNEDGSGQYDAAGTIMKLTYETEGDKLSILFDGNTAPFESTFSIDGDKLNIKDSSGKDTIYTRVK